MEKIETNVTSEVKPKPKKKTIVKKKPTKKLIVTTNGWEIKEE